MPRGIYWGLIVFALGMFFARAQTAPSNPGFIGVTFSHPTGSDFLVIDYVAAKSPAAEAGIVAGDEVVAIFGIPIEKMSATELKRSLETDIGSTTTLTIRQKGAKDEDISVVPRSLLDTYMPAISAGDHTAEVSLGYQYEHGPASVVDKAKALEWYQKAANAGDPAGERSLAMLYYFGRGVSQSDQQAYAWFYAAGVQDDSKAEYYLGQLYQHGRGVTADNSIALDWYRRSARHNNPYAEWNVGFFYEKGWSVKASSKEAIYWYQKSLVGLPDNEKLKTHIASLSLKRFVENPDSASVDPSLLMPLFGKYLTPLFYLLIGVYLAEGLALFYFSFKAVENPNGIVVALVWLLFYLEGQFIALIVLLLHAIPITAATLFISTCLFSALPLIFSTLGLNRNRVWKASDFSWKTLFRYGVGAYVIDFILFASYDKIYSLAIHHTLPGQPTEVLISKTVHGSIWLAFACIAVAMPVAEEILFRGYLFDALKKWCPDALVIIVTAFAFSLIHLQALYFAPLFGFGLVQGWIRLKTGSLRLPVFLHVLNNGLFIVAASS